MYVVGTRFCPAVLICKYDRGIELPDGYPLPGRPTRAGPRKFISRVLTTLIEISQFTLARLQLTLQRWLNGWRRLPEIVEMPCCLRWKHCRCRPSNNQARSKFRNNENLCQRYQAKPLKKHLFAVRMLQLRWHCALFFSYYHSQRLLFSFTKKCFSMTLTPTEKPRYTYWSFFCRFYLQQNNIDFLFLNRGPMCKTGIRIMAPFCR